MPVISIPSYPILMPDLSLLMVLDETFTISNVSKNVSIQISIVTPTKRMRPTPARRRDMPIAATYTAQNICNKDEFEEFYNLKLGKSIKMDFEGHTYYGYLSNLIRGEYDITFTFSYTSKIPHIEEEPGLYSL